jgi:hypothetical protein
LAVAKRCVPAFLWAWLTLTCTKIPSHLANHGTQGKVVEELRNAKRFQRIAGFQSCEYPARLFPKIN